VLGDEHGWGDEIDKFLAMADATDGPTDPDAVSGQSTPPQAAERIPRHFSDHFRRLAP
jgi:hypothetical protein